MVIILLQGKSYSGSRFPSGLHPAVFRHIHSGNPCEDGAGNIDGALDEDGDGDGLGYGVSVSPLSPLGKLPGLADGDGVGV